MQSADRARACDFVCMLQLAHQFEIAFRPSVTQNYSIRPHIDRTRLQTGPTIEKRQEIQKQDLSVGKAWVGVQRRIPHIKQRVVQGKSFLTVIERIKVRARFSFFTREVGRSRADRCCPERKTNTRRGVDNGRGKRGCLRVPTATATIRYLSLCDSKVLSRHHPSLD